MPRKKPLSYFLFLTSLAGYGLIGYGLQRHETVLLLGAYFLLFAIYAWVLKTGTDQEIRFWLYASILFRLSLLLVIPALSDDFYRFIWDGRLLANGIHPFAELPGYYLEHNISGVNQFLYDHLNSKDYYTIYPSFAQIIFWISAIIFPKSILGSVVVMRVFILAAEIGSLVLISKLLLIFSKNSKSILIYALNPLVILELMGNLHFEAFVIFFLLLALYLLSQSKIWQAGISFGLSVCAKLLPIIFLPLFLIRLGIKRSIFFYLFVLITCILFFVPLLDAKVINGFSESIGLYFKRFEFNASVYYLVREYGFWTKGFNTIQTVGWKLGVVSFIGIMIISLWPYTRVREGKGFGFKMSDYSFPNLIRNIPLVMMWVFLFYFLMTTTLHPWYITTMLMFSIFTPYRFVVAWTAVIFLTYSGYTSDGFFENLYVIALEYIIVIGYLVYELLWKRELLYP